MFEPARLDAVLRSRLLDTPPEEPFDRLARLARDLTGAPMAFVTVVDARRSYWKSCIGVSVPPGETAQNSVDESFCQYVVASGEPLVLPDVREDERTRDNPSIASMGVVAWAGFPVHTPDGQVLGSFSVVDTARRDWTEVDVRVLEALSQAASSEIGLRMAVEVARQATDAAERATSVAEGHAADSERVAVTLQRSLLTFPPELDHLEIEVRYRPSAAHAQVGGDWYDGFVQPDGATVVVVGDVVGHDIEAAAAMGQIRNMVRAIGYSRQGAPASVLAAVDAAMSGLHVTSMATAVVARVEQSDDERRRGVRRLRWSNAGHLPPLLVRPDGTVRPLSTTPDLLLGVRPGSPRHDHEVVLEPGSTLLLFTDGLIERRNQSMKVSIDALVERLGRLGGLPLAELCDTLLAQCLSPSPEDDVAILTLRTHPEDQSG